MDRTEAALRSLEATSSQGHAHSVQAGTQETPVPLGWTELNEPGRCRLARPLSWGLGTRGGLSPGDRAIQGTHPRAWSQWQPLDSGVGQPGFQEGPHQAQHLAAPALRGEAAFPDSLLPGGPPVQKLRMAGLFFFCWGLRLF